MFFQFSFFFRIFAGKKTNTKYGGTIIKTKKRVLLLCRKRG